MYTDKVYYLVKPFYEGTLQERVLVMFGKTKIRNYVEKRHEEPYKVHISLLFYMEYVPTSFTHVTYLMWKNFTRNEIAQNLQIKLLRLCHNFFIH